MSAKEAILEIVRRMPDDLSIDDVMDELYVRQKIEDGIAELDRGEGVTHESAKARMERWLK